MKNLAHEYALSIGLTVAQAREDWLGLCIDFAGEFVDSERGKLLKARMPYFDDTSNIRWKYHCSIEIHGWIHDLWHDAPMPLSDFMKLIGAHMVEYPAEQPDDET